MPRTPSPSIALRPINVGIMIAALTALSGCSAVENLWPFGEQEGSADTNAMFSNPFEESSNTSSTQSASNTTPLPGFAAQTSTPSSGFGVQPQSRPNRFPEATIDPNGSVGRYQLGPSYSLNGAQIIPRENLTYRETGLAGWYGNGLDGAVTANGERLNSQLLTFAHRTLPFSTIARLTNTATGRSVVARVNDRGPIETDRLIDVTTRIAQELGFSQAGRAQVLVEVLEAETRTVATLTGGRIGLTPNVPNSPSFQTQSTAVSREQTIQPTINSPHTGVSGSVVIQAGSFSDQGNALRLQATLAPIGEVNIQALNANGRPFWRVFVGPFVTESEARIALGRVVAAGATDAILRRIQ